MIRNNYLQNMVTAARQRPIYQNALRRILFLHIRTKTRISIQYCRLVSFRFTPQTGFVIFFRNCSWHTDQIEISSVIEYANKDWSVKYLTNAIISMS